MHTDTKCVNRKSKCTFRMTDVFDKFQRHQTFGLLMELKYLPFPRQNNLFKLPRQNIHPFISHNLCWTHFVIDNINSNHIITGTVYLQSHSEFAFNNTRIENDNNFLCVYSFVKHIMIDVISFQLFSFNDHNPREIHSSFTSIT